MIEQLNAISLNWWGWMSMMFAQVSLLILLISGIDILLRKWVWPQVRYALWFMVLLKLILPPTIASPVSITSGFQLIALKALGHHHTEEVSLTYDTSPKEPSVFHSESKMSLTQNGVSIPETSKINIKPNWQVFAMLCWLLGSLAILILLIKKISEIRKSNKPDPKQSLPDWFELLLIRSARRLNLQVIPNILITKKVKSPAIFGMIKPVLLLPTDFFKETSKKDAENILLHELAHIKRRDLLVKELETFLTIIYWFNPLFWGVKKQLQHLRELCCDSTVADILQKKVTDYRKTLLETARRLLAQPFEPGLGFLGLFEDSDRISTRLKWLEKGTVKFRWLRNSLIFSILIIVPLCVLPMSQIEFEKTIEEMTGLEEKIVVEMDKLGKFVEELDLLKEKLHSLQVQMEKITNKEIDSLEKILTTKTVNLESKIKEHLSVLKENEKELKEWKKDIEKWENQDLNISMDSLLKSIDMVLKKPGYIKLPVIKIDSLSFPPNPLIRIDTLGIPWDSLAIIEFGPDSAPLLSMTIPKHILDSSSWPCSIPASKIDIDFHDKDSECKSYKNYFSRDYDIKKGGKLQIYNSNGKVEVSTWNKKKVKVLAKITTKNPKYKAESQFIEVKTGSTMIIRTKDLKDVSVDFEIKVPQGTKVEKILNSNGKINIEGTKGPTYLGSSNGMIMARDIDGDIIAETSNGKIEIEKVSGFVTAKTSNGSIYIKKVKGIKEIKSHNGKIYVEIEKIKGKEAKIETFNANIELHLAKTLNADLEVSTTRGDIDFPIPPGAFEFEIIRRKEGKYLKAKLGKGGPPKINVKTTNGNVYIKFL